MKLNICYQKKLGKLIIKLKKMKIFEEVMEEVIYNYKIVLQKHAED